MTKKLTEAFFKSLILTSKSTGIDYPVFSLNGVFLANIKDREWVSIKDVYVLKKFPPKKINSSATLKAVLIFFKEDRIIHGIRIDDFTTRSFIEDHHKDYPKPIIDYLFKMLV